MINHGITYGTVRWRTPVPPLHPFQRAGGQCPAMHPVLASLVESRTGLFWSGLILSKCFGPIAGLHTKFFNNTEINNFFSWRTVVVLNIVTFASEVMAIFLQLILLANTAAFGCYLLGLVLHSFWEGDSGEEISTHQSLTWFLVCFKKRWPINRLFMPVALY